MKPIVMNNNLHTQIKVQAAATSTKMYDIMNKAAELVLWYLSLKGEQKRVIDEQVNQFLIDKELDVS